MSWKSPETEKRRFVELYAVRDVSMSELCRQFGISRQAGYELLARHEDYGDDAFEPQSRRPLHSPTATSPELVARILETQREHPHWGPRTLKAFLERRFPSVAWPARSTFGGILKRHGLADVRRRRRRLGPGRRAPCVEATAANAVWSIDFKGWFRLGSGQRCDPLTVTDNFSRYCIGCVALPKPKLEFVQPSLERMFRTYGVPYRLRSDNGPPFASQGVGGLSRLSVWLLKHGVTPEWIQPGQPQQNGRHERFHRTLKQYTTHPPRPTMPAQQRAFDAFRHSYNTERPHQALAGRCPADLYTSSVRRFRERELRYEYGGNCAVRSVRHNGEIKWQGRSLFISEVLTGERVALYPSAAGQWTLRFHDLELATYDEATTRLEKLSPMSSDNL